MDGPGLIVGQAQHVLQEGAVGVLAHPRRAQLRLDLEIGHVLGLHALQRLDRILHRLATLHGILGLAQLQPDIAGEVHVGRLEPTAGGAIDRLLPQQFLLHLRARLLRQFGHAIEIEDHPLVARHHVCLGDRRVLADPVGAGDSLGEDQGRGAVGMLQGFQGRGEGILHRVHDLDAVRRADTAMGLAERLIPLVQGLPNILGVRGAGALGVDQARIRLADADQLAHLVRAIVGLLLVLDRQPLGEVRQRR